MSSFLTLFTHARAVKLMSNHVPKASVTLVQFRWTRVTTALGTRLVSLRSLHLWRMPEMVVPRALVFRPLVKGNDDSGNEIGQNVAGPGQDLTRPQSSLIVSLIILNKGCVGGSGWITPCFISLPQLTPAPFRDRETTGDESGGGLYSCTNDKHHNC